MADRFMVQEVFIDPETKEEEELMIVKKLNALLPKIKPRWERVVVMICLEERKVLNKKGGKK